MCQWCVVLGSSDDRAGCAHREQVGRQQAAVDERAGCEVARDTRLRVSTSENSIRLKQAGVCGPRLTPLGGSEGGARTSSISNGQPRRNTLGRSRAKSRGRRGSSDAPDAFAEERDDAGPVLGAHKAVRDVLADLVERAPAAGEVVVGSGREQDELVALRRVAEDEPAVRGGRAAGGQCEGRGWAVERSGRRCGWKGWRARLGRDGRKGTRADRRGELGGRHNARVAGGPGDAPADRACVEGVDGGVDVRGRGMASGSGRSSEGGSVGAELGRGCHGDGYETGQVQTRARARLPSGPGWLLARAGPCCQKCVAPTASHTRAPPLSLSLTHPPLPLPTPSHV